MVQLLFFLSSFFLTAGANVTLCASTYEARVETCEQLRNDKGAILVHPYDDDVHQNEMISVRSHSKDDHGGSRNHGC